MFFKNQKNKVSCNAVFGLFMRKNNALPKKGVLAEPAGFEPIKNTVIMRKFDITV